MPTHCQKCSYITEEEYKKMSDEDKENVTIMISPIYLFNGIRMIPYEIITRIRNQCICSSEYFD